MPSNPSTAKAWLRRARGNLVRAKLYGGVEGTFYEDSCFDAQQASEKAMKSVLVHLNKPYPRTWKVETQKGDSFRQRQFSTSERLFGRWIRSSGM